ncbi:class I SAM-dependent methyltransferase [Flavobacterium sp. JP2137]|uniref:class I SAM-dependent methyltransferase n=1 Tax=Flavobacterium sp. JP2137 TaxID=3414510 RepID=UPI003D2FF564
MLKRLYLVKYNKLLRVYYLYAYELSTSFMQKSKTLRSLWYKLSSNQRYTIRKWYYLPIDTYDLLLGKRHPMVPPRGYIYTGSSANASAYLEQGLYQLELLQQTVALKPNHKVLDIGSGIGRTAIALTQFLNNGGSYDGFDVVPKGVDWCNQKVFSDTAPFRFKYIPIYNDLYNNSGEKACTFVFPYQNHSFDVVFSFSVFTHMQIEEIENYFREIHRVLDDHGSCFSTFFTYTSEEEAHIHQHPTFPFPIVKGQYRLMNDNVKSGNIAIHQDLLTQMLHRSGLEVVEIINGNWKSTEAQNQPIEYQDIVVFRKKTAAASGPLT